MKQMTPFDEAVAKAAAEMREELETAQREATKDAKPRKRRFWRAGA